jgi:hypothetical protein
VDFFLPNLIALFAMIKWMERNQELFKSTSLEQIVKKIKAVLKNLNHKFLCCICDEEFTVEDGILISNQNLSKYVAYCLFIQVDFYKYIN